MSVVSKTTQGGADFELLCTGTIRNYSFNPADIAGQREAEDIKQKLIAQLEDTVRELELQSDRTIANIYIGKTFIMRRKKPGGGYLKFDPVNSYTWRKKGICSRWNAHKHEDYGRDGLVVLGAITRETMPERCRGRVHQEDFALAMEQQLLYHCLLSHPDPRVVNETFSSGPVTKDKCYAYAVYMAFGYDDVTFSEEEYTNTPPFSPKEASEPDPSSTQRRLPHFPLTVLNSKQEDQNPSPASDDMHTLPGPSHTPAYHFPSSSGIPSTSLKQSDPAASLQIPVTACLPRQLAARETNVYSPASRDKPIQNSSSLSLSRPIQSACSPSPTRRSRVTFSCTPTSETRQARVQTVNQASSPRKNHTSTPSTPQGKGILKQTPEKQQPLAQLNQPPTPSCSSAQNQYSPPATPSRPTPSSPPRKRLRLTNPFHTTPTFSPSLHPPPKKSLIFSGEISPGEAEGAEVQPSTQTLNLQEPSHTCPLPLRKKRLSLRLRKRPTRPLLRNTSSASKNEKQYPQAISGQTPQAETCYSIESPLKRSHQLSLISKQNDFNSSSSSPVISSSSSSQDSTNDDHYVHLQVLTAQQLTLTLHRPLTSSHHLLSSFFHHLLKTPATMTTHCLYLLKTQAAMMTPCLYLLKTQAKMTSHHLQLR